MLVDDNKHDNFFHRRIIKKAAVAQAVKEFLYAEEALAYLKEGDSSEVDLIFLDINMPRMNGFEFLQHYSALTQKQKARAVIVMLTTSLNPQDRARARNYPEADGFLTKPLTEEMLKSIVARHFPESI